MRVPAALAYPRWFSTFCAPGEDRRAVLIDTLRGLSIPHERIGIGPFQHIQVRGGREFKPQPGETILLAHYDRVPSSPGANDNGASVLALVEYVLRAARPLRVIFTDGEELPPGTGASQQGAYALARSWGPVARLFPVVLDMTGIGDTLVLGHLGEHLVRLSRGESLPTELDAYAKVRWKAKRWLAGCGAGDTVEVNTPFSDDLGLFLAGIPSAQVSVLPRKQALAYRSIRQSPAEVAGGEAGTLPPAWQPMHSSEDRPETLWAASQALILGALEKLEQFS